MHPDIARSLDDMQRGDQVSCLIPHKTCKTQVQRLKGVYPFSQQLTFVSCAAEQCFKYCRLLCISLQQHYMLARDLIEGYIPPLPMKVLMFC